MHALYQRGQSESDKRMTVPTLYVRSLASYGGPEYSLRAIFQKAREAAPCYLVFEDLDSIVNDNVRSYFLNEVDGLKSNDGILMVGSTNHLDRLDPGISKRPSRFDRKYYFPDPDVEQRVAYAKFWQGKLHDNKDLEFPDELCSAIAKITDKFSFAYMQEAFVASLLAIAVRGDKEDNVQALLYSGPEDPMTAATRRAHFHCRLHNSEASDAGLDKLVLWKEIQVQVKILKEEMDEKSGEKLASEKLYASEPCPKGKMLTTPVRWEQTLYEPAEPRKECVNHPGEDPAGKPSLFSSFEQWKAANSSRLSKLPFQSKPVPEPKWVYPSDNRMIGGKQSIPPEDQLKRMVETPNGMMPEYHSRTILEDMERMRSEMLRYQASPPTIGTSLGPGQTQTPPHLPNWPVARGGLPLASTVANPTLSDQATSEWYRLSNPRPEPTSASLTEGMTGPSLNRNPAPASVESSAEWEMYERRLQMLKERKEFERKMEDIRAKIARIE